MVVVVVDAPVRIGTRLLAADGRLPQSEKPSYLMWLEWKDGRISFIRDYRYVRYIVGDAELVMAPDIAPAGEGAAHG